MMKAATLLICLLASLSLSAQDSSARHLPFHSIFAQGTRLTFAGIGFAAEAIPSERIFSFRGAGKFKTARRGRAESMF